MKGLIIGNDESITRRVRGILVKLGVDCAESNIVAFQRGAHAVAELGPDLIVLTQPTEAKHTQELVRRLRCVTAAYLAVIGNVCDTQCVLNAVRAGANDFLGSGSELDAELAALLNRIQCQETLPARNGTLITILSGSGGSGCSVLAANIATAVAQRQGKCGLIDLQLQGGDLATLLDLKQQHSILDLFRNEHKLDRGMLEQSLLKHAGGISLLPGPGMQETIDQLPPDAIKQVLQLSREMFPCVVIDLESHSRQGQQRVLEASDTILVVFRLDLISLLRARKTLVHLQRAGVDPARIQFVANRHGQPQEMAPAKAAEAMETPIQHVIPDDPKAVIASINTGNPVVLESPSTKVSKAIVKMAQSLTV